MFSKTVKTLLATSILSLSFSFFSSPIAEADQCLSQLPDSAWADGQPSSVKLDFRNLIITELKVEALDSNNQPVVEDKQFPPRGMVDDPQILLADSWILHDFNISGSNGSAALNLNNSFVAKISLTYQGVGCAPRTISYQKQVMLTNYSVEKPPQPASEETLMKILSPNSYQILSVADKNNIVPAWNYFISQLDGTKASPIQINSSSGSDDPIQTVLSSVGMKYRIKFSGGWVNLLNIKDSNVFLDGPDKITMPLSVSADRCLTMSPTFPFSKSALNLATLFEYGTQNLGAKAHFLKPGSSCGLSVFYFDGKSSLVQVGTLWVKDSGVIKPKIANTQKNVSINCVKGKSIKKVSGLAPTCPTGYKLRA